MIELTKEIPVKQLEWRNNPKVYATCRQWGLISWESQQKWLQKIEDDPTIEMFGIKADMGEGTLLVGTCGLTSISWVHQTAEYSMLIGPEFQGKGLASEALNKLLEYGFLNMNLETIWGEIFGNNPAGLKIAKNLGFKEEGTLRRRYSKDNKWIDTVMVSILREEWLENFGS